MAMKSIDRSEQLIRYSEHNTQVVADMRPGDMIQFRRGWYSHWGVCVGGTQIVHLTGDNDGMGDSKWHPSSVSVASSGVNVSSAEVQLHDFWDIVKKSKAMINNEKDKHCKPLHPEMIVQAALSKIGDVGYNMLYNNCEHFATWCRYGIGMSEQAERFFKVVAVGATVVAGVGILFAELTRPIWSRMRGNRSLQAAESTQPQQPHSQSFSDIAQLSLEHDDDNHKAEPGNS